VLECFWRSNQKNSVPAVRPGNRRGAFPKNARKKDGLHCYCKLCHSKRSRRWHKETSTSEKKRVKNVKQNYGLSAEEYQMLVIAQNGACAACGQIETRLDSRTQLVKNLHVDHDHITGKVRALLCHGCNAALGLLGDDPERIRLLLKYAERHQEMREKNV
jgi:Recombination endonuclease VII